MSKTVSAATKNRLFRYYELLCYLYEKGEVRISSQTLAQKLNTTASQVRQDFSSLGCFGHQGFGYSIPALITVLKELCGLDTHRPCLLIGVGSMGRFVANYFNFDELGFHIIALFDQKESLTGQIVRGMPVRNITGLDEFCRENLPKAAIMCLPREAANAVAKQLAALGIKGIWNLADYELSQIKGVQIENLSFERSLMQLSYKMAQEN